MANILFCAISCSEHEEDGAWQEFAAFVKEAKPHFILMMGDQVYVDEDTPNVFTRALLVAAGRAAQGARSRSTS